MSDVCPRCLDLRAGDLLSPAAIQWLKTGERGISSEAIFSHLTGIPLANYGRLSPPYDVGDYKRCRALLIAVPAFAARLSEMATASDEWAAIIAHWHAIGTMIDRGDTAGAYVRMRNILDEARAPKVAS